MTWLEGHHNASSMGGWEGCVIDLDDAQFARLAALLGDVTGAIDGVGAEMRVHARVVSSPEDRNRVILSTVATLWLQHHHSGEFSIRYDEEWRRSAMLLSGRWVDAERSVSFQP